MFTAGPNLPVLLLSAFMIAAPVASHAATQATQSRCAPLPASAGGPSNTHSRFVEAHLLPAIVQPGARPSTLAEQMRRYDVPGISMAVIHQGRIEWARGWGFRDTASCAPVTPQTAFQAASISKLATAVLALRLVE